MKKVFVTIVLSLLVSLSTAQAKTTFLPKAGNSIGSGRKVYSNANNAARCNSLGYIYTNTSGCGELLDVCPNATGYYHSCCPRGYRFTLEQCQAMGKLPVATEVKTCDYYACE